MTTLHSLQLFLLKELLIGSYYYLIISSMNANNVSIVIKSS